MTSRRTTICLPLFALILLLGFGGCSGSPSAGTPSNSPQLTLTASSNTVLLGRTVQFTANGSVLSWAVNGVIGGNSSLGTITSTGLYTAPAILPSPPLISISADASSSSATEPLRIDSDLSVAVTGASSVAPILTSSTLNLMVAITSAGLPTTGVTWTVNGVANGNAQVGTIISGVNGTAVYTAPATQPAGSIQIMATSVADPSKSAAVTQLVQGILLSATSGTPGQTLTLTGNFNTAESLSIGFSDGGSYSEILSVMPNSATQASVVLPMYATSAGLGVQGTLTVTGLQQSGTSTVTLGTSPGFTLQALPAAAGNPGDVTISILQGLSTGAAQAQNLWDVLGTASNGKLSVSAVDAPFTDMQMQLHALIAGVSGISSTPIALGTQNGSSL